MLLMVSDIILGDLKEPPITVPRPVNGCKRGRLLGATKFRPHLKLLIHLVRPHVQCFLVHLGGIERVFQFGSLERIKFTTHTNKPK